MAATVLYLLKAAVPLAMKCRPDNSLNELYKQGLAEISQKKLGEIKPPLAALDYCTLEGSCGEKKQTEILTMEIPNEIQTMKTCGKFEDL